MILTDTGPIVALLDTGQVEIHNKVKAALSSLSLPLVTTNACFTEMLYLAGRSLGFPAQNSLWQMRASGKLSVHLGTDLEIDRCQELMVEYRDSPMDYADASLVAAAESMGLSRVFTLDRHFYAYRLRDGSALEIIP